MGVSPLDLQTMYANMNNVARTVSHQQQGAVLAQQLQESKIIQQNAEKASQVHKAADNEAKSTGVNVNEEGNQGNGAWGSGQNGKKQNQNKDSHPSDEIRETYLGLHIDVER